MTLNYDILENHKLVIAKGSGIVTFKEIMSHFDTLSKDPRYAVPMKKLVDYRSVDKFNISVDEERVLTDQKAAYDRIFYKEKCAIVAPADLIFGMARMHSSLISESPIETVVYRDIQRALNWLEIDTAEVEEKLKPL